MPNLEVTATGNVTGAITGLQKVQTELVKTGIASEKMGSSIENAGKSLSGLGKNTGGLLSVSKEVQSIQESAKKSGVSLKELALNTTVPFSTLTSTVNKSKTAVQGAIAVNKQFAESAAALAEKQNALKAGIQGAIDRIGAYNDSSKKASSGTQLFGVNIASLLPTLLGPAGLGIGLAAVSVAMNLFKKEVHNVDLKPLADRLAAAKKEEEDFKQAVDSASKSVVGQAKDISNLKNILVSTTQEIASLTQATINQGLAAFLFDKKNVAVQKLLSAEIEKQLKLRKQNNPLAGADYVEGIFSKDKLTKTVAETKAEILGINQLSEGLGGIFKSMLENTPKAEKDIRTISDVLKELKEQITFLSSKEDILNTDETKSKLSALRSAFDELIKDFKLKGKDPIIIDIVARINRLEFEQLSGDFIQRELEKIKSGGPERTLTITPKIVVKPALFLDSANFTKEAYNAAVFATQVVQNTFTDAFSGIGDAIGNAVAGTGDFFGGIFSSMLRALGAGIRQLGIYAIATSKAILTIKATLGTTLGIAGGIALVALGALISAAANNIKTPKFATGVRNFSGGTAIVGERGPERIFLPTGSSVQPNNEVNAYGGGRGQMELVTRISGADLAIILKRGEAAMDRNN